VGEGDFSLMPSTKVVPSTEVEFFLLPEASWIVGNSEEEAIPSSSSISARSFSPSKSF